MNKLTKILLIIVTILFPALSHASSKIDYLKSHEDRIKVAFIINALANTNEYNAHRMNGEDNQVLLHKDGQMEVVLDSKGKVVEDCANKASGNFYHPQREPLDHFQFDTMPWIFFGNCKEDPTSVEQRTEAFLKDFYTGLEKATDPSMVNDLPKNFKFNKANQEETIAMFFKVMSELPNDSLSELLNSKNNKKEELQKYFDGFSKGFVKVLKSHALYKNTRKQ